MPLVTELLPSEILARVREIELRTRRAVEEFLVGRYHSAFRGRGIEFHEVREYLPGDDVRDIDWNVTARYRRPYIKTYAEERELTLLVLFDASPSMDYGSTGKSKRLTAVEILALLTLSAVRNDDRVGMVMFNMGREPLYYPPRKGRDYALRLIRDAYFRRMESEVPVHTAAGLKAALESVLSAEKRRVVLVIASDFAEDHAFETPLRVAARRHDCLMSFVYDPVEQELPQAGTVELEDPKTHERLEIDTSSRSVRAAWSRRFQKHRKYLTDLGLRNDIDFIEIRPDSDVVGALVTLFGRRKRRLAR